MTVEQQAVCRVQQGGISEIVLDLPTSMNTFRAEYVEQVKTELHAAMDEHSRCVLIRGAADVFSAGWDLASVKAGDDDPFGIITGVVAPFCEFLRELPIPTISAVAGPALGFGLGFALSCDICIADEKATFGSPFRQIGLVPDTGAHFYLLERLGLNKALELIYTGKMLNGAEAAAIGLVNRAVPAGTVVAEAQKLAAGIASGPTQAFSLSKRLLLVGGDYGTMMRAEADAQTKVFATADAAEGIRAFQERRKPVFTGK
jgi:2-(1,2-epoxy-1,2-dihydrophenyl)acetyl-CoA isomerase